MKKSEKGCFALVCVCVLLMVLTFFMEMTREQASPQQPLTLEDLDRLAEALQQPEKPAAVAIGQPGEIEQSVPEPESKHAALHRRLNRTLTDDQRREWYMTGSMKGTFLRIIGKIPLHNVFDEAYTYSRFSGGRLYFRGQLHLTRGNWSEARACFSELLQKSHGSYGMECAYLATLEEDPVLAARYLELACSGRNDPFPILYSSNVARATRSDELADYYERLFEEVAKDHIAPGQEAER